MEERIITDELSIVLEELNTLAGNIEAPPSYQEPTTQFEQEAQHCLTKWEQTGLLEKLPTFRSETAVLLENQRLINESMNDSGDIAQFKRISIPLVRRICGGLALPHFASVQPLLGPTG